MRSVNNPEADREVVAEIDTAEIERADRTTLLQYLDHNLDSLSRQAGKPEFFVLGSPLDPESGNQLRTVMHVMNSESGHGRSILYSTCDRRRGDLAKSVGIETAEGPRSTTSIEDLIGAVAMTSERKRNQPKLIPKRVYDSLVGREIPGVGHKIKKTLSHGARRANPRMPAVR